MKTNFNFKGLMVPVFTPFNDDKKRTINYEMIEKYCDYLKKKGMHGVMVNGMTGEGMTMTVEERKRLAEEWFKHTRKFQLTMLLNIGGTTFADVIELAEHAEKLGVDGILVLPDLFYKPKIEEDLVWYMKEIFKYAPTRPMLYYHMPMMTKVKLHMWRFYDLAEKELTTFGGVMYADGNLDFAMEMKKEGRNVIMGMGTIMLGTLTMGIDAISMTAMNVMPELIFELYDLMKKDKLHDAMVLQEKIFYKIREFWREDEDMIKKMKMEFNKIMKMGPIRKPEWMMLRHRAL